MNVADEQGVPKATTVEPVFVAPEQSRGRCKVDEEVDKPEPPVEDEWDVYWEQRW